MFIWGYVVCAFLIIAGLSGTAFFIVKKNIENDQKKELLKLKFDAKNLVTPLRIQAYERLTLLLERIEPNQLLLRMNNTGLSAQQFHSLLITTVRAEYEHNLSQQIFVSSELWNQIVQTKEETVKLLNLCMGKLGSEATSLDLATAVLAQVAIDTPNFKALETLRKEIRLLY
ncbi:MAG: hypothetical protein LBU51_02065 [Bacteroidales bacterium]|jgi:hypothetical protein|nr:hypothetical protein [Bacteroidales bacterium]